MAESLRTPAVRSHEKSLPSDLGQIPTVPARMGIVENSGEFSATSGAPRAAVREAMRRAEYPQKAFAIDAKASEGNVSEAFGGTRQLPWAWIWAAAKANSSFRVHLLNVLAEVWDVHQDAELHELEEMCGRMVKMAMRVSRKARTA